MIPAWADTGVLPPTLTATGAVRAPYRALPEEVAERFGSSHERRTILAGLFALRASLRAAGLGAGFQWLDGSFVEQVELLQGRPPQDVDVVSFLYLGDGLRQQQLKTAHPTLFEHDAVKAQYLVDHYLVSLDVTTPVRLVRNASYWYSMWSHRRDGLWKGFVQLDMAAEDGPATARLAAAARNGSAA